MAIDKGRIILHLKSEDHHIRVIDDLLREAESANSYGAVVHLCYRLGQAISSLYSAHNQLEQCIREELSDETPSL